MYCPTVRSEIVSPVLRNTCVILAFTDSRRFSALEGTCVS